MDEYNKNSHAVHDIYNEWECIDICPDTLLDAPSVENIEEVEERLFAHI